MGYTAVFGGSAMLKSYILMNRDKPLTKFTLRDIAKDDFVLSNVIMLSPSPYGTENELFSLIETRKPAKNREYLDSLLDLME